MKAARPGDEDEMVVGVAGDGEHRERAERVAVAQRVEGAERHAAEPLAQRRHGLGVVGVIVRQRDAAGAAARGHLGRHRSRCDSIAGPGSTTHAGSRPTIQVFVPLSVSGLGLGARDAGDHWTKR